MINRVLGLVRPVDIPGDSVLRLLIKVAGIALLYLGLAHTAEAQTGPWTTQGPSNCSDQYGSFDAFIPGMRGFGSCNRGGFVPNTNVIIVTNRNATGTGSLHAALTAGCPKVIIFNVGGLIARGGRTITTNCNQWSLVGASAPGQVVYGGTDSGPLVNPRGNNWTIDHMIFAAGDESWFAGPTSNRDSINLGNAPTDVNQGHAILMNNTIIWGFDAGIDCYPNLSSPFRSWQRVLFWQNIIGVGLGIGHSGGVMTSNPSCADVNIIRTAYVHSNERAPNIRADGWFLSNNLHANINRDVAQISTCLQTGHPYDSPTRMMGIHSLVAKSNTSDSNQGYLENPGGSGCTPHQVYEEGIRVRETNGTVRNCANHSCSGGRDPFNSSVWQSSPITSIYPTGYVPETIPATQAGIEAFADQVLTYVGSRPLNRLPYIQARVIDEATGMVNGSDTSSTFGETNPAPLPGRWSSIPLEGGISQITPANTSWTVTNQCGGMPTGAAADSIQSSGLTGLHEWVIGCFYDNVMPGGYREDGLQNYPAPGGGGSGPPPPPPPPRPNPPEWGVG